jgi:formyltetrahydrofolate deformylase
VLRFHCPDRIGIVASVATFLANHDCNILESAQFGDESSGRFFMRTVVAAGPKAPARSELEQLFAEIGERFHMNWELHDASTRPRVLILVSRLDHCLNDLLYRHRTGGIAMAIPGIISNHPDLKPLADFHSIPYHYLPLDENNRSEQEAAILGIVEAQGIELVVLARYMQILSPEYCARLEGRAINIHHSFLPSFQGAKPYQQAYARGVKLIGATAHYVTPELDNGPIIEQETIRVTHAQMPGQLRAVGQDLECLVLARAVKHHCQHRVLLNGNKTVVFQ